LATGRDPRIATGTASGFSSKWHAGPAMGRQTPLQIQGNSVINFCLNLSPLVFGLQMVQHLQWHGRGIFDSGILSAEYPNAVGYLSK
jgi:hypothetical protein